MRKTKLYNMWVNVQTSFWFVPAVMILALFCLSFLALGLDHEFASNSLLHPDKMSSKTMLGQFLKVGPDGARAVLTTIAGSMITVAGVTFSITIVALTLAASQFGPRLLRNFMQDKSTQFVLGSFSATFVYCLLILRSIQPNDDSFFVPTFSVNLSVVFAIISVGVLIFFIHHISVSLKAEYVISSVYNGLSVDIDRIFNDLSASENGAYVADKALILDEIKSKYLTQLPVAASKSGYVQAIDHASLITLASQHECVIQLHVKAGDFSVSGSCIATVRSTSKIEEDLIDEICEAFILGIQRTPEQDVEYAIHQLVEIAVRSLSKGINDPFTAISCVDYLSSLLCNLAEKQMPDPHCLDSDGELRLVTKEVTYRDFLDSAFNQLRQNSSSSIAVTIRMMDAFIRIAKTLQDDNQKEELHRHACMLFEEGKGCIKQKQDRDDLEKRYEECISILSVS